SPETVDSPLVRGMYDLVFAYEGGDPGRPRFAAGLGLFLASKLFFEYQGWVFWKRRAGMGEVVFAPLYAALRARGVRFEFFSRVERLHLAADRRPVAGGGVGRQAARAGRRRRWAPTARRAAGAAAAAPGARVGAFPSSPARPRRELLAAD